MEKILFAFGLFAYSCIVVIALVGVLIAGLA
jgi:hypothetical protein